MATKTIAPKEKGQKAIKFQEGGEHKSLGVPAGQKIPASKAAAAKAGKYGPKAQKQEQFRENVLKGAKNGYPDAKDNIAKGLASAGYPTAAKPKAAD